MQAKRPRGGWSLVCLLAVILAACAGDRPRPAPSSLPAIPYTIQVGAFSTVERAARYAEQLTADGLDAYHFIDRDGLSKVRFERFGTKADARRRVAEALSFCCGQVRAVDSVDAPLKEKQVQSRAGWLRAPPAQKFHRCREEHAYVRDCRHLLPPDNH